MWRLIKWLFFIIVIGSIVLWYTGIKIKGKTFQEHLKPILESKDVKEGIRDIRSIVGEGLKAAGEVISEDVTESERKQLDDLVKKEMEKGTPIESAPGQTALPAVPLPGRQPVEARPGVERQLATQPPPTTLPVTQPSR